MVTELWFPNSEHQNHLEGLAKHILLGPPPRDADGGHLGCSNKFPNDADTPESAHTLRSTVIDLEITRDIDKQMFQYTGNSRVKNHRGLVMSREEEC